MINIGHQNYAKLLDTHKILIININDSWILKSLSKGYTPDIVHDDTTIILKGKNEGAYAYIAYE